MSVSLVEQETTINFGRVDEDLVLWTSDKTVMTKIDKLEEWELIKADKINGEVVAKKYKADKRLLTFRSRRIKMDEERKQIALNNLKSE